MRLVEVATGTLPPGLSLGGLTPTTFTLTGTPSQSGDFVFAVRLFDLGFLFPSKTFTMKVEQPVQITSIALSTITPNIAYSEQIRTLGGNGGLTFSIVEGALPSGLTLLGSTGLISGTITAALPATGTVIRVRVTDLAGSSSEHPFTLVSNTSRITTVATPPAGSVGTPYSFDIDSDLAGCSFFHTFGDLPPGLTVAPATGIISGTPTNIGMHDFVIRCTAGTSSVWKPFRIGINGAGNVLGNPRVAMETFAYNHLFSTFGGVPPYIYSVVGNLPSGILLNPSTGALVGELPIGVAGSTFTINSTDATGRVYSGNFTITTTGAPTSSGAPPPPIRANNPTIISPFFYSSTGVATFRQIGGEGRLVLGLDSVSGQMTVNSPTAGTFNPIVFASDTLGGGGLFSDSIQVFNNFRISLTGMPNVALTGTPANITITTANGAAPVTFAVTGGAIPAGMSFSGATGVLSGFPTTAGPHNLTITATDAVGQTATQAYTFTAKDGIRITSGQLTNATVGVPYNTVVSTVGGANVHSLSGAVPPNLSITLLNGTITGTPTTAGTFTFTVTATTGAAVDSDTKSFTIIVSNPLSVTGPAGGAANVTRGAQGLIPYTVTGGRAPYDVSVFPTLSSEGLYPQSASPFGINGVLERNSSSSTTVTIRDVDGRSVATALAINPAEPVSFPVSAANVPFPTLGQAYSHTITGATGGNAPYTFSIPGGALPTGLTQAGAVISGTPTANGTFNFDFRATDADGRFADLPIQMIVRAAVVDNSPTVLPAGVLLSTYNAAINATGGEPEKFFTISAGNLPPLIELEGGFGTLGSVPLLPGTYNFTVRTTDAENRFVDKAHQITVGNLAITTLTFPNGTTGTVYPTQTIQTTGGVPAIGFSVLTGALPTGLALSTAGVLSGTPTAAGTFTFTIQANDQAASTATQAYTIIISNPLQITTTTLPNGFVGAAYSQTVATSGGRAPITFGLTSALPAGLTLNASTGAITGTPTAAGTSAFTITATDADARTAARALSITVAAPAITPPTLPNGVLSTPYSAQLTFNGPPVTIGWSIASGALPAGLTLSPSTGLISGSPTALGTSTFVVAATPATAGAPVQQSYSITVTNPATITPPTLPNGTVGTAYSGQLTYNGPAATFIGWTIAQGALPGGLTLGASTGLVSGTPNATGTFTFVVLATPSTGPAAQQSYTVTITNSLSITTATLPDATAGEVYATALAATGGLSPYTWSTAAALPAGLTLNAQTGAIGGTPTTGGTFPINAVVTDSTGLQATRALSLRVFAALTITTNGLNEAVQNRAYQAVAFAAQGGLAPYAWSLVGGGLPAGLTFSAAGVLSGTTAAAEGLYPQQFRVTDSRGRSSDRTLAVSVVPPPAPPLTLSPDTLPNGTVGVPYSAGFSASGGTPGYTFAIVSGSLPPGLQFNGTSITGTPSTAGTYVFFVNATDSVNRAAGLRYSVVIEPALLPLTLSPDTVANAMIGEAYSTTFTASGGRAPYTISVGGGTPPGLSSNSSGLLSGTPNQAGSFTFTVTATDSANNRVSKTYTITVGGQLIITTQPPLAEGTVGTGYSASFAAAGGRPPYQWSIAGDTPPGVGFDSAAASLSGTPTAAGSFAFTVTVRDALRQVANASFTIRIYDMLQITNAPSGAPIQPNQPYDFGFATTGGKPPITFALTAGNLPPGISLGSNGSLSGSPTTPGIYNFTVQASDPLGNRAQRSAAITVAAPLTITTASLANGTVGVAYSAGVAATGGVPPLSGFSISAGSLPAGLSLSGSTISGTPTTAGASTFTVRINDSLGTVATRSYTITIALPPLPPPSFIGLPTVLPPGQQTNITLQLAQPFPAPVNGSMTMTFVPNALANADDPAVQFSTGGRSVTFNFPANATNATFPADPLRILTGTVAGTIRISTATTPASSTPVPDREIAIARSVPVITSSSIQLGSGAFTLVLDGYSNTRELSAATIRLIPTAGAPLQTTDINLNVTAAFASFYQTSTLGGVFRLTIPFNVAGTLNDIDSLTVTLTNSVGNSQPATVRLR